LKTLQEVLKVFFIEFSFFFKKASNGESFLIIKNISKHTSCDVVGRKKIGVHAFRALS
jgi:hypothetical protein